ncbi:FG-GAP-like repeat-containing protein [Streptomyces sp. BPTC-684]|uniref:FG-GAP repeat domain-containing protein n=1 Tax=Streptomyces sp. BPTC-684 TaxID=3043734 RepID=UPI0024B1C8B9|nr:FG-GAP-like repeat-containing protein [Streptomyces sp. BPTC-684]WHM37557.1 FG-GAP-like repeat-containing protein [Streptomyces sp. BPTC-684]
MPRAGEVLEAGATGYVRQEEGTEGTLWTDNRSGETKRLTDYAAPSPRDHSGLRAQVIGTWANPSAIQITDQATGAATTVELPDGYRWTSAYTTDSVVAYRLTDKVISGISVFRKTDGKVIEQPLTGLPQGATAAVVVKQDGDGAVLRFGLRGNVPNTYLLRYGTGTVSALPRSFGGLGIALAKGYVLGFARADEPLHVIHRDDPSAETKVPLPTPTGTEQTYLRPTVVGDWIVFRYTLDPTFTHVRGNKLWAMPVTGGTPRELLAYAGAGVVAAPDGTALVTGGTGPKDWAIRRVTVGADGAPSLTVVRELPPVTAQVKGIALGTGALSYFSDSERDASTSLYERKISATGEVAEPIVRANPGLGTRIQALGDGHTVFERGQELVSPGDTGKETSVALPDTATLVDGFGQYAIGRTTSQQYVGTLKQGVSDSILLSGAKSSAALWGSTLWRPVGNAGTIEAYDLRSKQTTSTADVGCNPQELQALGRWIYWSCGPDKAGVYDRELKRSVAVPGGDVLLGDGFTVRHDHTANKLALTDFSEGAGTTPTTSEVGEPKKSQDDDRRLSWTVDKFGGDLAYVDAEERIHIRRVTVRRSPLAVTDSHADTEARVDGSDWDGYKWHGSWQLSQLPVAWAVTVEDSKGRVVRTLRGAGKDQGALVSAVWDGADDKGAVVPGGHQTWRLKVDSGDGAGLRELASGDIRLWSYSDKFRDLDSDGLGDLLGITPNGALDFRLGTGRGGVDGKLSGASWKSVTSAVPFGDFNGDRRNDVLVRVSSGELRAYNVYPGSGLSSEAGYTRVGTGWNIYDTLTSPGDLTGDGRPDVLAREASTGDLYLYADNGARNFKPRVKIGRGWTGYALTGASDVNGDGKADLLARDASGVLWLYPGTGKGTLATRVKVGGGWQVYNALVGAGDLNGDGKPDLLARDTSGVLWSYAGDGKGNFAGRQRIGGGWQMYKYLF